MLIIVVGIVLGSFWDHVGIVLGSFLCFFGGEGDSLLQTNSRSTAPSGRHYIKYSPKYVYCIQLCWALQNYMELVTLSLSFGTHSHIAYILPLLHDSPTSSSLLSADVGCMASSGEWCIRGSQISK